MLNLLRLKSKTWLAVIVALCIIARLTVLLAFPSVFAYEITGAVQGNEAHDTHANNLVKHGVFGRVPGVPDADFPPLYVYLLAGLYGTLGRGHIQVGLFQIWLDAISVVLLYHIGKRLFPGSHGETVGLLAGLFYALYPYIIFQNLTLIETPLFIAELYGFLLIMILLRERPTWDRTTTSLVALGGLILGLGLLTRPNISPLVGFVALWFLFRLNLKQTILRLATVVIISVLVIVPWLVRNFQVFHTFVLISTNAGENFYIGNGPYTVPFLQAGYHPSFTPPESEVAGLTLPQKSAKFFDIGFRYLREHPEQIPSLVWSKFLAYWSIDVFPRLNPSSGSSPIVDYQGVVRIETNTQGQLTLNGVPQGDPITTYSQPLFDQIGRTLHRLYFGGLLILALIGIVLTTKAWRDVSLLWFVQICMTLLYAVIFNPATRYRVPTDGLLFMFSAYTLVVLWETFQARRSAQLNPMPTQRVSSG